MPGRLPRIRLWTEAATREAWLAAVARHAAVGVAFGVSLLVLRFWAEYLWVVHGLGYMFDWRAGFVWGIGAAFVYALPSMLSAALTARFLRRFGRERRARAKRLFPRVVPRLLAGPRPASMPATWLACMVGLLGCLAFHLAIDREMRYLAEEAVVLPFAAHAQEGSPPHPYLTVNITKAKGAHKTVRYLVKKVAHSSESLRHLLAARAAAHPRPEGRTCLTVKIRADAYVEFGHIWRVLESCRCAGIERVSFGVAPEMRKEEGSGS